MKLVCGRKMKIHRNYVKILYKIDNTHVKRFPAVKYNIIAINEDLIALSYKRVAEYLILYR